MIARFYAVAVSAYVLAASTVARAGCSPSFTEHFSGAQRVVDSLRPDKPGQMRVFAYDGSEYTAAEALWMKGQLRSALQACAQGDETAADSTLHGVTELLNSRHRAS